MSEKYVVKVRVHHAGKGTPPQGDEPGKPGKMTKLEPGDLCPPELVGELKKQGLLKLADAPDKPVEFGRPVHVGEPGEAGVYEDLPHRDGMEDEPKPTGGKYPSAKKGK